MATEIVENLYDTIKGTYVPNDAELSEKAKRYVTILRMQMELEKQKEQIYLELNEQEKQEANNILRKSIDYPEYLSVRDVSDILEVTPQMVRRYCADGRIEARQRIEGSGKWLIPTDQFLTHPNWSNYIQNRNKHQKQSINIASKMLQYLEEDTE